MDIWTHTKLIFAQAWESTKEGFVGSIWKFARWLPLVGFGFLAQYRLRLLQGPPDVAWKSTMSWVWDTVGTIVIPTAFLFVVVFIWNLCLAPGRLLKKDMIALADQMEELDRKVTHFLVDQAKLAADMRTLKREAEEMISERHGLIERDFSTKFGSATSQTEHLASEVQRLSGQLGVLQVHFGGTLGDLANRVAELENGKSK